MKQGPKGSGGARQKSIALTKQDVFDVLEDGLCKCVSETAGKHDCTTTTYVFPRDGKHYMFTLDHSYNEGLQLYDDSIQAVEVEPFEVKKIEYRPVFETCNGTESDDEN
jgi:hypothetical protein